MQVLVQHSQIQRRHESVVQQILGLLAIHRLRRLTQSTCASGGHGSPDILPPIPFVLVRILSMDLVHERRSRSSKNMASVVLVGGINRLAHRSDLCVPIEEFPIQICSRTLPNMRFAHGVLARRPLVQ